MGCYTALSFYSERGSRSSKLPALYRSVFEREPRASELKVETHQASTSMGSETSVRPAGLEVRILCCETGPLGFKLSSRCRIPTSSKEIGLWCLPTLPRTSADTEA